MEKPLRLDNDFIRSWLDGLAQEEQGGPDMGNALPVQALEPEDIAFDIEGIDLPAASCGHMSGAPKCSQPSARR